MKQKELIVFEDDGIKIPDICGDVIELINNEISGSKNLSVATIFVYPGKASKIHYHKNGNPTRYFPRAYLSTNQ